MGSKSTGSERLENEGPSPAGAESTRPESERRVAKKIFTAGRTVGERLVASQRLGLRCSAPSQGPDCRPADSGTPEKRRSAREEPESAQAEQGKDRRRKEETANTRSPRRRSPPPRNPTLRKADVRVANTPRVPRSGSQCSHWFVRSSARPARTTGRRTDHSETLPTFAPPGSLLLAPAGST